MKKYLKRIKNSFSKAFYSQLGSLFSDTYSLFALGFVVIALSVVTAWIPDGLYEICFDGKVKEGLIMVFISLVLLVLLLFLAKKLITPYRYGIVSSPPSKKRALILFLSNAWGGEEEFRELLKELETLKDPDAKLDLLNGQKAFRSWRMPLEAVKYHLERLERVLVLTSDRSSQHFPMFKELLFALFPSFKGRVEELFVGDFEDFEKVQRGVEEAYGKLKEEGFSEREVILDITGGQKIVSIVGALLSLNPRREFQYVSTTDYSVKSYDLEVIRDD